MDNITGLRYAELEKRPTYEELIDIIVKDFKVKLPDRTASFIYNSPEIQNLLAGDGSSINDIEEHEVRKYKEEVKEIEIKKQASTSTQTAQQIRTQEQGTSTFQKPQIFDMTLDDRIDDVQDDVKDNLEHHAHNLQQQKQQIVNIIHNHLREDVTPGTLNFAHKMVTAGKSQSSTDVPHFAQNTPMPSKEPARPEVPTHTSSNTGPPPPPPAAGAITTETTGKPRRRERNRSENDVLPRATPKAKANPAGIDGPASAPVPTSVTTRGRPRARVKREVKQEGFAPPPPPPAAPAVTTETTDKPRRERSKSKDDTVRPPGKRAQVKKEIKEEILPPPVRTETTGKPRARSTPVRTETTSKPRARSTPATPAKRVKKEEVKEEVKEEPQPPRPAEARYIKPTGKATAVKSMAKPKVKQEEKLKKGTVKKEEVKKEIKKEVKEEVKEEPPPSKKAKTGKGTGSPYLSQRSDAWWNKQTKADIIKEVERLDGFVATTAQKNSITKADWIRMAKAAGKPDDENNAAQLLKVKVEEGARRSKTKSRK